MSDITFSKTQDIVIIPVGTVITTASGANFIVSSVVDLGSAMGIAIHVYYGRGNGTAHTTAPVFSVETCPDSTNNSFFSPVAQFSPALGTSLVNTTLTADAASAATAIIMASANVTTGKILMLAAASTANYEFVHVAGVSSTTVTLTTPLDKDHASTSAVTEGEIYAPIVLDGGTVRRFRVSATGYLSDQLFYIAAKAIRLDKTVST